MKMATLKAPDEVYIDIDKITEYQAQSPHIEDWGGVDDMVCISQSNVSIQ